MCVPRFGTNAGLYPHSGTTGEHFRTTCAHLPPEAWNAKTVVPMKVRFRRLHPVPPAGVLPVLIAAIVAVLAIPFFSYDLLGKLVQGIPFVLAPLLLVVLASRFRLPRSLEGRAFVAIAGLMLAVGGATGILTGFLLTRFYPVFFFSDLGEVAWLLGVILLLTNVPRDRWIRPVTLGVVGLGGFFLLWSLIGPVVGWPITPRILSSAVLLGAIITEWEMSRRPVVLGGLVAALLAVLALLATGKGTSELLTALVMVLAAVGSGLLPIGLTAGEAVSRALLVVVLGLGILGGLFAVGTGGIQGLSPAFDPLTFDILDHPLVQFRLNEVEVALTGNHPILAFLGHGHGAVYEAVQGVNLPSNVNAYGHVHPIHVGPALMVFRYGILGLGLLFLLGWMVLRMWASPNSGLRPRPGCPPSDWEYPFLLRTAWFATVGMLVTFLAQNVIVNPFFGIFVGIVLSTYEVAPYAPRRETSSADEVAS